MNQGAIVIAGILGVFLWLFFGFFLVVPWQVVSVLVAASIGITTLLLYYERSKSAVSISQAKPEKKHEEKENKQPPPLTIETKEQKDTIGSSLLPDITEITKLGIDNNLLDQIYEHAHSQAIDLYPDPQLSIFTIRVNPFYKIGSKVIIYLDFYSQWADKKCTFRYSDANPQVEHTLPDKPVSDELFRKTFTGLPWKKSPQWMQFLNMVYVRIKPLSPAIRTGYHLSAYAFSEPPWRVTFEDGFTGKEYEYEWNGKGLDEDSIKQVH